MQFDDEVRGTTVGTRGHARSSAVCALLFVAAVAAAGSSRADGDLVSGTGTAKDGDDVIVNGIDFRLQGIAAPEDNERRRDPRGPEATANMRRLVDGKQVICDPDGTKARERPVAVCTVDGRDLGEIQVEEGFARDCPRYSGGRYADAEARARAAGLDLSASYALPSYCLPR